MNENWHWDITLWLESALKAIFTLRLGLTLRVGLTLRLELTLTLYILTVGFTLHYELALPLRLEPKFVLTSIMIQTMEILIKVFRWTERKSEHAQKILSSKTTGSIFIFFLNSKQNKRTGNAHPSTHYVQKSTKIHDILCSGLRWVALTNRQDGLTGDGWVKTIKPPATCFMGHLHVYTCNYINNCQSKVYEGRTMVGWHNVKL